jgi:hypothetical protein
MKKIKRTLFLACFLAFVITKADAQISVSLTVGTPPPALPVYVQPACPTDGYLWVPGYWAYDNNDGYYWVPGVWVAPPQPGLLWTPAYWGYSGGYYGFHAGYWGPHVGYYGGINYGYGYGGVGYGGGEWRGGSFRYNTAVVNVNTTVVHNTYIDNTVINKTTINNHTSFNGPGGVTARPQPQELAAMREPHVQPTSEQFSHQQVASKDRSQFASVNNGHPAAAAMNHVGGKPFNEGGHEAVNSTLGRPGNTNGTPGINRANINQPANGNKPGNAAPGNQQHPQQRPAQPRQAHGNPKPPHEKHN